MGYQALLFCTDEKLARVVSQLFSDLEFAVSPISDPFAAVKNLLAQHYDAVVIDCENEQSASLMIKSARNSTFNVGSLAIGLVEGQAGVAKAYRMGANLVLTKPINVEAAKGTLRVARGLLRKGTEAAAGNRGEPGSAAEHPNVSSFLSPNQNAGTSLQSSGSGTRSAASPYRSGEDSSETDGSATPSPAFAKSEQAPTLTPAVPTKAWTSIGSTVPVAQVAAATTQISSPQAWAKPEARESADVKIEPRKPAATPVVMAANGPQSGAAAPAPAKIATHPEQPAYEEQEEFAEDDAFTPAVTLPASGASMQGPSFSMETEQAGGSGNSRKILIGAAAVLLLIGAYFGWNKFAQSDLSPAPVATVPHAPPAAESSHGTPTPVEASPAAASDSNVASPAPGHTTTPQAGLPVSASPVKQPSSTQTPTTPTGTNRSGAIQTAALSESLSNKAVPAAILVKPGSVARNQEPTQNRSEEALVQPPSPLGVAAPAAGGLSEVLTPATAFTKPALSRVKLSQGVSQGLLIKRVEPQYPRNALATHTEGAVQIEASVDKEGRVVNPKVLSGPFLLAPAALEAVRQWRYKPYYLDGEPVEVQTQITINFKAH